MESLSREKIEEIGKQILSESDIIGKHGTSIENGRSIMETGFNFNKTSMVIQKSDNVVSLCTYGWKENEPGNCSNVIISIPKTFFKDFLGMDDEKYSKWIDERIKNDEQEAILMSVSDIEYSGFFPKTKVPKEFIRGMFVYTDNKNYLSFGNNMEEGMNHLTYFDNPNYYNNYEEEEKNKFVSDLREIMFGGEPNTKTM